MPWEPPRHEHAWRLHVVGLLAYMALAAAAFGAALRSPATTYVGSIPDATQSIWFLSWTAHALTQHHGLLFTDAMNAPGGVNLMWNTPMLLLGVIAAPITLTLGPVVAYNLLMVMAFALSAWAAYYVIDRYCRDRLASWVGGLLFAFSPYMVAQSLGHLDLVVMIYPPIALLLLDEILVRQGRRWWVAGGLLGLATAAQFLVMEEVVVDVAIGCAAAVAIIGVRRLSFVRARLQHAVKALAAALLTFLACSAVPLWYQLAGPQVPPGFKEVANSTSSDLLGFVAPTANQVLAPGGTRDAATHFVAQTTGQDAYVGLPMLALVILVAWTFRKRPEVRIAALLAAAFAILSLGPWLNVGGRVLPVPLPWALVQHVPLVNNVVPLRLMGFADLFLAGIVAWGLARCRDAGRFGWAIIPALAMLTVASWFPTLPRPQLAIPSPASLSRAVTDSIPAGSAVVFAPLPSQSTADAMWYQIQDSFRFRLVAGYAYRSGPDLPLASVLDSASDSQVAAATRRLSAGDDEAAHIVAAYRAAGVSTIVVPPGPRADAYDRLVTSLCGGPPLMDNGFAVWSLVSGRGACRTGA